jgi:hypothetical protein
MAVNVTDQQPPAVRAPPHLVEGSAPLAHLGRDHGDLRHKAAVQTSRIGYEALLSNLETK